MLNVTAQICVLQSLQEIVFAFCRSEWRGVHFVAQTAQHAADLEGARILAA